MSLKPIFVEWIDSTAQPRWGVYEEADLRCQSVGFLIEKRKDKLIIAMNSSAYSTGDYMTIPMVAVKRIRKLK